MASTSVSTYPCRSWYFKREQLVHTPSTADGIDGKLEKRYRKEGASFIFKVGYAMGLHYNTVATGIVFFHRFYIFHSFRKFPRHVTACCCLFVAGKVEETPKKCDDIVRVAKNLLSEHHFKYFGGNAKDKIITLERILLRTIRFDFNIVHPYTYLMRYIKCMKNSKNKLEKLFQMAWTFTNDSLCTTLCLQWEPEIIAVASMYLASKLSKIEVCDWTNKSKYHENWWDLYVSELSIPMLDDICHQILDQYEQMESK